jgi:hypothetical protein
MPYDLKPVEVPALRGRPLRALAWLLDGPFGGAIARSLLRQGGLDRIAGWRLDEPPTMLPIAAALPGQGGAGAVDAATAPATTAGGEAGRLGRAYRDGTTTPTAIAEAFLAARAALDGGETPLAIFVAVDADDVRAQAGASTARFAAGAPLGPLDGVPVAIKDELDQRGYPTRVGSVVFDDRPAATDATVVARLRAAGALLVGKTNMHEIGINPTGGNVHAGQCRNPHDPAHDPGGSSSGSAASSGSRRRSAG